MRVIEITEYENISIRLLFCAGLHCYYHRLLRRTLQGFVRCQLLGSFLFYFDGSSIHAVGEKKTLTAA